MAVLDWGLFACSELSDLQQAVSARVLFITALPLKELIPRERPVNRGVVFMKKHQCRVGSLLLNCRANSRTDRSLQVVVSDLSSSPAANIYTTKWLQRVKG
jgi:hypothetical protein